MFIHVNIFVYTELAEVLGVWYTIGTFLTQNKDILPA